MTNMLSNKVRGLLAILLLSLGIAVTVRGQKAVGEVMCACPGASKPLGNAANCEDACYGRRSSSSGASSDTRAREEARAREESEARAREEAEASERDRVAAEKRKQDEANRKAFEASRDEAARTLKGSTGTRIHSNADGLGLRGSGSEGSGGIELRGSRDSTALRTGEPRTETRDFSGPHAAWKQLYCAASILGPAISNLGIDGNGTNADYAAFKVLASEATNALNGHVKGVPCAKAPEPPTFSSKYSDPAKLAEAGIRLVDKAVDLATKLEKAREQKAVAQAELNKPAPAVTPATPDESVMAQQRRIIAMREAEAKHIAQADRDFKTSVTTENEAKAKLGKISEAVKEAEKNPEDFGVLLDEEAPAPVDTPINRKPTRWRAGKP
jgi:hypothetical protein